MRDKAKERLEGLKVKIDKIRRDRSILLMSRKSGKKMEEELSAEEQERRKCLAGGHDFAAYNGKILDEIKSSVALWGMLGRHNSHALPSLLHMNSNPNLGAHLHTEKKQFR